MPEIKASEALRHHQNLIYRRCLEKLQAEQPLSEDELAEVNRRNAEDQKAKKPKEEKNGPGPKTKLTRDLIKRIYEMVANGDQVKIACACCGISEARYYAWMQMDPDENPLIKELQESMQEAKARCISWHVNQIRKASSNGNWNASAWYLERVDSKNYARKDRYEHSHSGPDGKPLPPAQNVTVIYMPDNGYRLPDAIEVDPKQLSNGNGNGEH